MLVIPVVRAYATNQYSNFDSSSLNDASLSGASFDKVSFDEQLINCELDVHEVSKDVSLPILFRGDLSPVNASYTINRPGIYKLTSSKTASGVANISITANNVMLDLGGNTLAGGTNGIEISGNNVTVKNGTIIGMTQSGVRITGDNCLLQDITARGTMTGFELNGADGSSVRLCRALNNTREGFLLVNAQKSSFEKCEAVSTSGAGTVAGFKTTGGTNNSFIDCTINGVLSSNADAYGLLGLHETQARIDTCTAMNITGSMYVAGIGLIGDSLGTPRAQEFVSSFTGRSSFSVDWLNTPAGSYIASANSATTDANAKVDLFSVTSGLTDFGYTGTLLTTLRGVSWLNWNNAYYLAIGGGSGPEVLSPDIKVFSFDPSNALSLFTDVASYPDPISAGGAMYSLDWFFSGTIPYLAFSGDSGISNEFGILEFTGNSLNHIASAGFGSTVRAVKAHTYKGHIRLAIAMQLTSGVRVYGFDEPQGSQTLVLKVVGPTVPNLPIDFSWLDYDGKTYLAVAFNNNVANNVIVFAYTEEPSASLTEFASYSYGSSLQGLDWLVTGTTVYLAVSGNNAVKRTLILRFDPYQNSTTTRLSDYYNLGDTQAGFRLRWNRVAENLNRVYLAVGKSGTDLTPYLRVFGFDINDQSQLNIVSDNIISGMSGGDGVLVDFATNVAYSNVAYNCQDGFETSLRTSYLASEYAGELSNFVTSQANSRGVYNIDTNLTTPDTVSLIADQVSTIESKVDVLYQDSVTVESKLDYLTACDYDPLPAPTILSTDYGAYCLSADMSGDLSITGSGIILSLNGHTISGGTNGIFVSGNEVVIKNGTVRNASASGIKIAGDKCTLQDITAVGNVTGFEFNGADNCTVSACRAIDNTREGFLLTNAQKNSFEQCEAITTSGAVLVAGIKTTGGTDNNFIDCTVNGVTSSAGEAYGLLASNEQKTRIARCAVNSVNGQNYTAGVALIGDYLGTPTANDFTYAESRNSRFPEWLNTPVGTYLAISNEAAPFNARIFQFSPTDGLTSVTTTQDVAAGCRQATWLSWHNKQYLAMVGDNDAGNDIFVYEFNLATNTLTTITSYAYSSTIGVFGCDWIVSGTLAYLAYVVYPNSGSGEELGVLRFDGSTLTKVSSLEYISTGLLSVKHHLYNGKIRIAVTQHPPTGRPDLIIHSFNEPQGSEALTTSTLGLVSYDLTGAEFIEKCGWFDFDGQTYLAFGIVGVTSTSNVRVLRYTENPTPTLTAVASFNYGGVVQDVDALVTGTTVYLAVGGGVAGQMTKILTFDPYADSADRLKSYYNCSADASQSNGVSWNRCPALDNKIFLGASKASANPRVYGFTLNNQSQLNLVSDCIVADVKSTLNGSGFLADNVINSVTDNRAYNCQEGFVEGVRTQRPGVSFDTSNWPLPG